MKRQWTADELVEHWTLQPSDLELLTNKASATRLGCAVLLKYFQYEGRFPQHKGDVPPAALVHVAHQLGVAPELYTQYDWRGRTVELHRAQIGQALGVREATVQDAEELASWLRQEVLPHDHRPERAQEAVYARCRTLHLEPSAPGRIDRLVRSALRSYEEQVHRQVLECLGPEGLAQIDRLLVIPDGEDEAAETPPADPRDPGRLSLRDLKADPGRVSLESVLTQIARLRRVRQVALPETVFTGVSAQLVRAYRQRAAAEPPSELRAHAEAVRATLVAALCLLRRQEITDGLVDLLIATVHKIGARAERRVTQDLVADIKRVSGKNTLLYRLGNGGAPLRRNRHGRGHLTHVLKVGHDLLKILIRGLRQEVDVLVTHACHGNAPRMLRLGAGMLIIREAADPDAQIIFGVRRAWQGGSVTPCRGGVSVADVLRKTDALVALCTVVTLVTELHIERGQLVWGAAALRTAARSTSSRSPSQLTATGA